MRESEVAQSCPTLRDPMDCSLPGSSVHGIFQARVVEWGAIAFSKSWNKICWTYWFLVCFWVLYVILLICVFKPVLIPHSEKAMAPHSSTLAWRIPWTEEPGRLQSMGSRRVEHDWATSLSRIGEGNGNPLQCSCLENPRDGGACWAAIYGVAQSRTRLKWLGSPSLSPPHPSRLIQCPCVSFLSHAANSHCLSILPMAG